MPKIVNLPSSLAPEPVGILNSRRVAYTEVAADSSYVPGLLGMTKNLELASQGSFLNGHLIQSIERRSITWASDTSMPPNFDFHL